MSGDSGKFFLLNPRLLLNDGLLRGFLQFL
jgi:hypothetical protein